MAGHPLYFPPETLAEGIDVSQIPTWSWEEAARLEATDTWTLKLVCQPSQALAEVDRRDPALAAVARAAEELVPVTLTDLDTLKKQTTACYDPSSKILAQEWRKHSADFTGMARLTLWNDERHVIFARPRYLESTSTAFCEAHPRLPIPLTETEAVSVATWAKLDASTFRRCGEAIPGTPIPTWTFAYNPDAIDGGALGLLSDINALITATEQRVSTVEMNVGTAYELSAGLAWQIAKPWLVNGAVGGLGIGAAAEWFAAAGHRRNPPAPPQGTAGSSTSGTSSTGASAASTASAIAIMAGGTAAAIAITLTLARIAGMACTGGLMPLAAASVFLLSTILANAEQFQAVID